MNTPTNTAAVPSWGLAASPGADPHNEGPPRLALQIRLIRFVSNVSISAGHQCNQVEHVEQDAQMRSTYVARRQAPPSTKSNCPLLRLGLLERRSRAFRIPMPMSTLKSCRPLSTKK